MIKSKYAYCDNCDKDVGYYIIESTRTTTIDGVSFTYPIREAHCKHCGNYVDPISNTRENMLLMSDAHKQALGLLTSVEIKELRRRLHLTQTELARLIGIGEKNIARYENGERQIKSIDNALRRLIQESFHPGSAINQQIGALLTKSRVESNLTIEDLSKKTNITEYDITNIENGTGDPKLSKITKLFKTLGKSITITVI